MSRPAYLNSAQFGMLSDRRSRPLRRARILTASLMSEADDLIGDDIFFDVVSEVAQFLLEAKTELN